MSYHISVMLLGTVSSIPRFGLINKHSQSFFPMSRETYAQSLLVSTALLSLTRLIFFSGVGDSVVDPNRLCSDPDPDPGDNVHSDQAPDGSGSVQDQNEFGSGSHLKF